MLGNKNMTYTQVSLQDDLRRFWHSNLTTSLSSRTKVRGWNCMRSVFYLLFMVYLSIQRKCIVNCNSSVFIGLMLQNWQSDGLARNPSHLSHRNLTHSTSAGKLGDQFSPNAPPRTTPIPLTTYTQEKLEGNQLTVTANPGKVHFRE